MAHFSGQLGQNYITLKYQASYFTNPDEVNNAVSIVPPVPVFSSCGTEFQKKFESIWCTHSFLFSEGQDFRFVSCIFVAVRERNAVDRRTTTIEYNERSTNRQPPYLLLCCPLSKNANMTNTTFHFFQRQISINWSDLLGNLVKLGNFEECMQMQVWSSLKFK